MNNSLKAITEQLIKELSGMETDERIKALNYIREELHKESPFKEEPCDCVLWIKQENIQANEYNPNHVAAPEMKIGRAHV